MARSSGASVRVLCLGNELVADDAFGPLAAGELRRQFPEVEVVESPLSGFYLLDHLLDVGKLVVIDTILTGRAEPGTVHVFSENDVACPPGGSPHYTGIFEALALGRGLELAVPDEVVLIAVEAADLTVVGGPIHPVVRTALPEVVELVEEIVHSPWTGGAVNR